METVTTEEMKQIEQLANENGVTALQLMENAGTEAYRTIRHVWPQARSVVIFAGKGNNGGDGFVVARLLAEAGVLVNVILCEGLPVTKEAQQNFHRLQGVPLCTLDVMGELQFQQINAADVLVDALYGTGFYGEMRKNGLRAAALINTSPAPVCALDLPSGMDADTGEIAQGAVKADLTVVFHCLKEGHTALSARIQCGKLVVADIGIGLQSRLLVGQLEDA